MSIAKLKKGDTVILRMFTGCPAGVKKILAADKDTITIETGRHGDTVFSRKTGKQINPEPKNERYANYITEDDGSFVPPMEKAKASKNAAEKKSAKKPSKKAKPVEEDEDEDEYEEA